MFDLGNPSFDSIHYSNPSSNFLFNLPTNPHEHHQYPTQEYISYPTEQYAYHPHASYFPPLYPTFPSTSNKQETHVCKWIDQEPNRLCNQTFSQMQDLGKIIHNESKNNNDDDLFSL